MLAPPRCCSNRWSRNARCSSSRTPPATSTSSDERRDLAAASRAATETGSPGRCAGTGPATWMPTCSSDDQHEDQRDVRPSPTDSSADRSRRAGETRHAGARRSSAAAGRSAPSSTTVSIAETRNTKRLTAAVRRRAAGSRTAASARDDQRAVSDSPSRGCTSSSGAATRRGARGGPAPAVREAVPLASDCRSGIWACHWPGRQHRPAMVHSEPWPQSPKTTRPERVLIVEDDAATRRGLAELVRTWGFATEAAADGEEALKLVTTFRPAIVVTDLFMPRMDGLRAAQGAQGRSDPQDHPADGAGLGRKRGRSGQRRRRRLSHQAGRSAEAAAAAASASPSSTRRSARTRCCGASCAKRAASAASSATARRCGRSIR